MKHEGLTLLEILVVIVVIGILAALLLPHTGGGGIQRAKATACASNLQQLFRLGTTYASTHKGEWPTGKGSELWLSFAKTTPPLLQAEELEVLLCPVYGEWMLGQCDYLGPRKPYSELKPGDALGADKPGNHGEDHGGNVLLKDGSVQEFDRKHPIWDGLAP